MAFTRFILSVALKSLISLRRLSVATSAGGASVGTGHDGLPVKLARNRQFQDEGFEQTPVQATSPTRHKQALIGTPGG